MYMYIYTCSPADWASCGRGSLPRGSAWFAHQRVKIGRQSHGRSPRRQQHDPLSRDTHTCMYANPCKRRCRMLRCIQRYRERVRQCGGSERELRCRLELPGFVIPDTSSSKLCLQKLGLKRRCVFVQMTRVCSKTSLCRLIVKNICSQVRHTHAYVHIYIHTVMQDCKHAPECASRHTRCSHTRNIHTMLSKAPIDLATLLDRCVAGTTPLPRAVSAFHQPSSCVLESRRTMSPFCVCATVLEPRTLMRKHSQESEAEAL
jgi:hypothetical protein